MPALYLRLLGQPALPLCFRGALRGVSPLLAAFAIAAPVCAQTSTQTEAAPRAPRAATPYVNRNLVFLDPAHGGQDTGAHIGSQALEKDLNLSLASGVRALLAANNVGVLMSRDADANDLSATTLTSAQVADNRAGMANHARPVACVLFHATPAGSGVHVILSPLAPAEPGGGSGGPIPWDSAQATFVAQSERLADSIGGRIRGAGVPVRLTRASVRPLDNLLCPAVVVEVGPLPGSPATPVSDAAYQSRVTEAVGAALVAWHKEAEAEAAAAKAAASTPTASPAPSPTTAPVAPTGSPAPFARGTAHPPSGAKAAPSGSSAVTPARPRAPKPRPIPEPAEPAPPAAPIIRQPPAEPAPPAPIIRRPPPPAQLAGTPPGEAAP